MATKQNAFVVNRNSSLHNSHLLTRLLTIVRYAMVAYSHDKIGSHVHTFHRLRSRKECWAILMTMHAHATRAITKASHRSYLGKSECAVYSWKPKTSSSVNTGADGAYSRISCCTGGTLNWS